MFRYLGAVPRGKVTTYSALAEAIGSPRASRAVGNALHGNPDPVVVPCHRVVRSDGSLGGYALGRRRKAEILAREGVACSGGRTDLDKYGVGADFLKNTIERSGTETKL